MASGPERVVVVRKCGILRCADTAKGSTESCSTRRCAGYEQSISGICSGTAASIVPGPPSGRNFRSGYSRTNRTRQTFCVKAGGNNVSLEITYPDLPISARKEEIVQALRQHQVL